MKRVHLRLGTLLVVIAFLALLLVIVMQQVQLGRQHTQIEQMRLLIDAGQNEKATLAKIIREQTDHIERQRQR
jgi:uncharacterized protein involved in response to NO